MAQREIIEVRADQLRVGDRGAQLGAARRITHVGRTQHGQVRLTLQRHGRTVPATMEPTRVLRVERSGGRAGDSVRSTAVSRTTGVTVQVLDCLHPDCPVDADYAVRYDDDGSATDIEVRHRWATLCTDHGIVAHWATLAEARSESAIAEHWCGACGNGAPARP